MVGDLALKDTDDAKEAAIVDAARRAFLARGFDAASMDYIALSAGVSKRTVYNRFRSKEALFAAAINESCRRLVPTDVEDIEAHLPPEEFIGRMARVIVRGIFSEESIALRRIATFEAGRNPALGRSFLEYGPRWLVRTCSESIARMQSRGVLRAGDPEVAVWQLGSLITEPLHTEVLLGDPPPDLELALERQIQRGLDAFFKLYDFKR
ncbi:MAG: TetR/AcrR family transcriptional regulator [Parvularculaceae bacterium]|nr:TetR/AcrR family transcriptional regulator [Parvularculaceae bacterium]